MPVEPCATNVGSFAAQMATKKVRNIVRTKQVGDILRFLAKTPAAANLILDASRTFGTPEEPGRFLDLRRVREKMKSLEKAGFVNIERYAVTGHQPTNFYHLSRVRCLGKPRFPCPRFERESVLHKRTTVPPSDVD